jgi:hypothetical protein
MRPNDYRDMPSIMYSKGLYDGSQGNPNIYIGNPNYEMGYKNGMGKKHTIAGNLLNQPQTLITTNLFNEDFPLKKF